MPLLYRLIALLQLLKLLYPLNLILLTFLCPFCIPLPLFEICLACFIIYFLNFIHKSFCENLVNFQPFTAPSVKPWTIYFCAKIINKTCGIVAIIAPAHISDKLNDPYPLKLAIAIDIVGELW